MVPMTIFGANVQTKIERKKVVLILIQHYLHVFRLPIDWFGDFYEYLFKIVVRNVSPENSKKAVFVSKVNKFWFGN